MPLYTLLLLMGYWPLPHSVCDLWLSLDYTLSNASVGSLLAISVDRYLSITRPLTYRAKRTPRRALMVILAVWTVSVALWTPWIYAWPHIEGRKINDTECYIQFLETSPTVTVLTAMAAFYVPVCIITCLYCRIFVETRRRRKQLKGLQASRSSSPPHNGNKGGSANSAYRHGGSLVVPRSNASRNECSMFPWSSLRHQVYPPPAQRLEDIHHSFRVGCWRCLPHIVGDQRPARPLLACHLTEMYSRCSQRAPWVDKDDSPLHRWHSPVPFCTQTGLHVHPSSKTQPFVSTPDLRSATTNHLEPALESLESRSPRHASLHSTPSPTLQSTVITTVATVRRTDLPSSKPQKGMKDSKAAKTLSAILLAFILTWTPYNVFVLVNAFHGETNSKKLVGETLYSISYWLCYLNSTINPILYFGCNSTFRITFKRLLACDCRRHAQQQQSKLQRQPLNNNAFPPSNAPSSRKIGQLS